MLEQLVHQRGITDVVSFLGRVSDDELLDAYGRAWVVASVSLREGWGMTLTQAAATGTPAVATDIPGHRDAVDHQECPGCSCPRTVRSPMRCVRS